MPSESQLWYSHIFASADIILSPSWLLKHKEIDMYIKQSNLLSSLPIPQNEFISPNIKIDF